VRICFVSVRGANHFMTELLSMLSAAVANAGHEVDFAFDEFPSYDGETVYVVIPHEFHGHLDASVFPDAVQCARTIALCTENPGTEWFEAACHLLQHFGAVAAINRGSVAELRRRGIPCEHLQLGYSRLWDRWRREADSERPIDVLYMGSTDARRNPLLAATGHHLWDRRCEYLVPALESRYGPRFDYLTGIEKYDRLRSAALILNFHRDRSSCFEWVRFLEAAVNGCVFVTEPSLDHGPLIPGEHLVVSDPDSIALVAARLLADPERLRRARLGAYDFVREQLPMGPSVERLVARADELHGRSSPRSSLSATPLPPRPTAQAPGSADPDAQHAETQAAMLRSLSVETRELRRAINSLAHRARAGADPVGEVMASTPAYRDARPRVSVVVTVHDYEREVIDALASIADSRFGELEVLIVDDGSSDDSAQAVTDFLTTHPWLPGMLLHHPVNLGLAASRNAAVTRGRGEYVFVLDADNGVYPSALGRLVAALDEDPEATFAYPMIAVLQDGRPVSLRSSLPWEPARLRGGNYIDAMALIRREDLLELGGYTTEPRLTGWEDFHLWCRCAETGRYGVIVPQVLAWYRRHSHSMSADNESSTVAAWSIMRARFPELRAGSPPVAAGGHV